MRLRESAWQTVAVLSHNKSALYMVPTERYAAMLDAIDDLQLVRVAKERLLVYMVEDDTLVVLLLLSVGKREDSVVYSVAAKRIK